MRIRNKTLICNFNYLNMLAKASVMVLAGCQVQQPQEFTSTRVLMGTYVEVKSVDKRAAPIVFSEIKRVEDLLSKYNPESEVSRLNKLGKTNVGPELHFLLTKSKEYWFATDGAFDISVGPLMDLWGFTGKKFSQPSKEDIQLTLKAIGTNKIIFHSYDNVVEFSVPGMEIDLGAIAKGYAVDQAVKVLRSAGVRSCLINAGGQIYCLGTNAGQPWRVAIADPRGKEIKKYFDLTDKSISTSGDYEQYFMAGAKRFSHIMDPSTGYPSDSGVVSATVIADDGLTADFLSTSLLVMGKHKGTELLKRFPGVRAEIIEQEFMP